MQLDQLLINVEHSIVHGNTEMEVEGIAYDSRNVREGYLFIAIKGLVVDGHDFIESAIQNGASAVIGEDRAKLESCSAKRCLHTKNSRRALAILSANFFENPSQSLGLIGVTGTNGKTSTTMLLKTILRTAGHKTGLFGTIENSLDDEILPAHHTTPESRELQEMLGILRNKGAEYTVMEVSSHALALERVYGCDFQVGVYTNLTQDHLDFHPNMEEYFQAKLSLFKQIDEMEIKNPKGRYIVLNNDDSYSKRIADTVSCKVLTYGIHAESDYMAKNIHVGLNGIDFELIHPLGSLQMHLRMTGEFTVYNCLAAVAIALEEGIETDIIKRSLAETKVPGRFEPVQEGQDFAVVVDYAHTPDSLQNAIRTAKQVAEHRVISIFGCGGDRDRSKRSIMGKIGTEESDYAIITSDNPRTEEPTEIIKDILAGVTVPARRYETITDRRKAIQKGIAMAKKGDLVLIAGKGHEDYQIIGTKKYPFSDLLIAREAIKERDE
ncbi:UDP-N-acetylmuramoyl-L-alanyl-D-glutamate--2,6-diaminopimelate ligase [Clostridia bacterium]|nr:UDP-N-acetylmuramoyl-L-alanyl-D-glutamate--2,6-diaminopimelate ligase [Clostridia bacterium]